MFLKRLPDYPLANLLHSDNGVAICQLEAEPLKDAIIELWNAGRRHLVLEAADGSLLASCSCGCDPRKQPCGRYSALES
jgi:hypothetical protein